MPQIDQRVDVYIENSAEFARPILKHLRELVHQACPDVVETMKWSSPYFNYKGSLAGMAAFKQHCAFGFWKHKLLEQASLKRDAMGSFGRITSLDDLPGDKDFIALVHQAMELNESGVKVPKKTADPQKEIVVPDDVTEALQKNKHAKETFDNFSYSHRKEYIEWINEAKTEPTRQKRIATTVEWVAEGKGKNWRYQKTKE